MAGFLAKRMKPISIEFVRSPRWLAVWAPAFLLVGIALGVTYMKTRARAAVTDGIVTQALALQAQAHALQAERSKATDAGSADQKSIQLRAISRVLQRDWNVPFASIENLSEPGTKLLSFSADAASDSVRVEYEVDSMSHAAALTAALNAGYETPPWKLDSATASAARGRPGVEAMRATWTTKVEMLR